MARPRKPPHLHVIEGTGRKDRYTAAALASGERDDTPIAIPLHLSKGARHAWTYLVPVLQRMGVLMPDADELALSRLCECWAEIQELDAQLRVTGPTCETGSVKDGLMVRANPQVAMRADADRRFKSYLSDFGLTPAARSRVEVSRPAGPDPLDRYFD